MFDRERATAFGHARFWASEDVPEGTIFGLAGDDEVLEIAKRSKAHFGRAIGRRVAGDALGIENGLNGSLKAHRLGGERDYGDEQKPLHALQRIKHGRGGQ